MSNIYVHRGDLPEMVGRDARKQHWNLSVDIETSGLNFREERIGCITIGASSGDTHIVQIRDGMVPWGVLALLENSSIEKHWHYGIFDLRFIVREWPDTDICGVMQDTKILAKLLGEPSCSLKPLLAKHCGIPVGPNEALSDWFTDEYTDEQLEYCRRDVAYLPLLTSILYDQLPDDNARWRYIRYMDGLVPRVMAEVFEDAPDIWGSR